MIAKIRLDRQAGNSILQCRAQICELRADKGFSPNQTEVSALRKLCISKENQNPKRTKDAYLPA